MKRVRAEAPDVRASSLERRFPPLPPRIARSLAMRR
jgi:hypothetical protein